MNICYYQLITVDDGSEGKVAERRYFQGGDMWHKPAHQPPNVLNAFIVNVLNHFLLAEEDMTVNALYHYANALLRYLHRPTDLEACAPFYDVAERATARVNTFRQSYLDAHREDYAQIHDVGYDTQAFMDRLTATVPEITPNGDVFTFFSKDFVQLDKNTRIATAFAFLGLLFTVLHDPAFATLCKDKDVSSSALTPGQKANEPLDPEALYRCLQSKLDVAWH